jgi:hypothetical protein
MVFVLHRKHMFPPLLVTGIVLLYSSAQTKQKKSEIFHPILVRRKDINNFLELQFKPLTNTKTLEEWRLLGCYGVWLF